MSCKIAIKGASEDQWHTFFETLRNEQLQQIRSADGEKLVAIKQTVIALDLVEQKFIEIKLDKLKEI